MADNYRTIIIPFPGMIKVRFKLSDLEELMLNCLNGSMLGIMLRHSLSGGNEFSNIISIHYNFDMKRYSLFISLDPENNSSLNYNQSGNMKKIAAIAKKFIIADYNNEENGSNFDYNDDIPVIGMIGNVDIPKVPVFIKNLLNSEFFLDKNISGKIILQTPTVSTLSAFNSARELGATPQSLKFYHENKCINTDLHIVRESSLIYTSNKNYKKNIMKELERFITTSTKSYLIGIATVETNSDFFEVDEG